MGWWISECGICVWMLVVRNGCMLEFIELLFVVFVVEFLMLGEWGYEIKFDGYWMFVCIDVGDV